MSDELNLLKYLPFFHSFSCCCSVFSFVIVNSLWPSVSGRQWWLCKTCIENWRR